MRAFAFFFALTSSLGIGLSSPRGPIISSEGQSYWRDHAKSDIQRMLKAQSLNYNVAKNVIIFVGDGMGINTVSAARVYKAQKLGNKFGEGTSMSWESVPFSGLSKTYNTNHQVPDSAGTATALFSGVKTGVAFLGMDHRPAYNECDTQLYEKSKVQSILKWAQDAGKETGIVTTARITHATPAATYSHVTNREFEADINLASDKRSVCKDIAKQLITNDVAKKLKVAFGGGRRNFFLSSDRGRRLDENLVDLAKKLKKDQGEEFDYLETTDDLRNWEAKSNKDAALGLFSQSHMSYEVDRDTSGKGQPSLSHMTKAAINRLAQADNGFFLMVESGRIDHAHHDNNAYRAFDEAFELDKTIKEVMEHPFINPAETLIIVTADHSHAMTFNGYPERGNNILGNIFTTNNGDPIYDVYRDGTARAYSTISYANGPGFYDHFTGDARVPWRDLTTMDTLDVDYKQPAMTPGPENSETHGGEDVAIYAMGPMAHLLTGVHEQNYIAHVMAFASCYGPFTNDCDRGATGARPTRHQGSPTKARANVSNSASKSEAVSFFAIASTMAIFMQRLH